MPTTGFDNLKSAIGQGADDVIGQMKERAENLYKEFGGNKTDLITKTMKEEYIDAKKWLDGKAAETAQKITGELDQLVQEAKPKEQVIINSSSPSNQDIPVNASGSQEVSTNNVATNSTLGMMTPELMPDPNFEIITRDEAQSKITSSTSNVSESVDTAIKSDVLTIQTSAVRMANNTISKATKGLSDQRYANLSSAFTVSLLELGGTKTTSKLTNTKLSGSTMFAGINNLKNEFDSSGFGDILGVVNGGSKMFSGGEELLRKYEDIIELICQYPGLDRGLVLDNPLGAQQLLNKISSKSTAQDIDKLIQSYKPTTDAISSRLTGLKIDPKITQITAGIFEKLGGGDADVVKKMEQVTSQIDTLANQGLDKLLGGEFGEFFAGLNLDEGIVESILKRLDNTWIRGALMSLGFNPDQLRKMISGELDGTQKRQYDMAINTYQQHPKDLASTELVNILGLTDTEDGVYKSLLGFSTEGLKQGLVASQGQPHPSVLLYLSEKDEGLRDRYFDVQSDGSYARNSTIVSSPDLTVCAQGFVSNATMISAPHTKAKFLGLTLSSADEYASASIGYFLKGNMGMKGALEYGKNTLSDKPKETVAENIVENDKLDKSSQVSTQGEEIANGGFKEKLGTRYISDSLSSEIFTKNFAELTSVEIGQVMHEFFDQGKYAVQVDEVLVYLASNPIAGLIEMFIGLAEKKDGYDNPLKINNDPNKRSEQTNYGAFQISTKGNPTKLAHQHFKDGMKKLNITGVVDPDSRLGQLIGHLGGHIISKGSTNDLLSLKATSPKEEFHRIIKDKIQIGGEGFKTDHHVYSMLHSKVGDMFQSKIIS